MCVRRGGNNNTLGSPEVNRYKQGDYCLFQFSLGFDAGLLALSTPALDGWTDILGLSALVDVADWLLGLGTPHMPGALVPPVNFISIGVFVQ
jgi:hypothetical protein